nr:hypothetical protein [Tanacetum cinerariifolium]
MTINLNMTLTRHLVIFHLWNTTFRTRLIFLSLTLKKHANHKTRTNSDSIEKLIAQRIAEALTAYEANKNNRNENGNWNGNKNKKGSYSDRGSGSRGTVHTAHGCTYKEFLNYQPCNFKRTEGVVGLERWFKKIEYVFYISNCAIECQVKYATCTLLNSALTWWNSHVKKVRIDGVYDMSWNEIMKMKTEQLLYKRHDMAMAYTARPDEKREYTGNLPLCNKCKFHHTGLCIKKCRNYKRVGHTTRDCRSPAAATNQRTPRENQRTTATCYECKEQGHYKSDCLKLKNRTHGNQTRNGEALGRVYALGGG